ncbi:MAG: hypothetical protein ACRECC_07615 [Pseudolabrys sp.]
MSVDVSVGGTDQGCLTDQGIDRLSAAVHGIRRNAKRKALTIVRGFTGIASDIGTLRRQYLIAR